MAPLRCSFLLLAACATAPAPAPERVESAPSGSAEAADVEAAEVLARRYAELAQRHDERFELLQARDAIRKARALRPAHEDYRRIEEKIERDLGGRAATVSMIAHEAVAAAEVKREEELITVKRLLAEAERAKRRQQWEQAKRAYERALFVLDTSRFREDADFQAVSGPTRRELKALPDVRAEAERRQRDEALKELAR